MHEWKQNALAFVVDSYWYKQPLILVIFVSQEHLVIHGGISNFKNKTNQKTMVLIREKRLSPTPQQSTAALDQTPSTTLQESFYVCSATPY